MSKLRIVVPFGSSALWTGGTTYISNLIAALNKYATEDVEILKFENPLSKKYNSKSYIEYFKGIANTVLPALSRKILGVDYRNQYNLESAFGKNIDIVFNFSTYLKKSIATLPWLPDFQQLHLPEYFAEGEAEGRNNAFMHSIKRGTLIVLSSNDAYTDLKKFAPDYADKARVMHFVAHIPENLYSSEPAELCSIYHLPEKFIYLPNQFWKHKNHETVFKAMQILKKDNILPFLVCTGNLSDYRNPAFISELIGKLSLYNIREQVAILGLVPHLHVYQLLRQSAFVINPSFFEGWSTTVEEAKSVGKKILLSNLNVHIEQSAPEAEYFDPKNAEELAVKIKDLWLNSQAGPDSVLEQNAINSLPERMKSFANTFVSVAKEAVKINKNTSS
jgi:glycosyltransferase involved in cell wall biosynthesis